MFNNVTDVNEKEVSRLHGGRRFYILWNPDSGLPPKVTFVHKEQAIKAAEHMATRHGAVFYVMEAQARVGTVVPKVEVQELSLSSHHGIDEEFRKNYMRDPGVFARSLVDEMIEASKKQQCVRKSAKRSRKF